MDIFEIRAWHLGRHIDTHFHGNRTKFAEEVGKKAPYINGIFAKKNRRNIGQSVARELEEKLNIERGAWDIAPTPEEMQQYHRLIKKLDNLKVFTTKSSRVEAEMKATAERYMKTANLEELMRVNDNGRSIKILVKSGAKDTQIRELLMFIDGGKGEDSVLMSLTGDFDLNEISVLTDKMRFPGGDDLKKATKGKK